MKNISKVQKKLPKFAGGIFITYSETSWTSTRKFSFCFFFQFNHFDRRGNVSNIFDRLTIFLGGFC